MRQGTQLEAQLSLSAVLKQAKRVLKPDGLLLAKITDMVNNHRSKWAHCDFMRMAEDAGFTVCDVIIKIRSGPMVSNKRQNAHHARKRHCFWIVCRNGEDCKGRPAGETSRRGHLYPPRHRAF